MRIAPHHVVGTPENDLSERIWPSPEYQPQCAWPEDCMVQWGNGIIPSVPFFEAFPKGTFIRGEADEGGDIAEAERKAFEKYQRDIACDHVWGRQRPGGDLYTNGAAFCRKCGGFRAHMFPEIKPSGWWRRPLSASELWLLRSNEENHELNETMDKKYPDRIRERRLHARSLHLRYKAFGAVADDGDPF